MDLDPDFFCAIYLQKTQGRRVVAKQDVGRILDNHDLVGQGEVNDLTIEVARGNGSGWAVRIVDDQELGPLADVGRNRSEVGVKAVLGAQRQLVNFAAVVARVRAGDGIARH